METDTHIDGDILRTVMRNVPSPVVIVTAVGGTEARGITIGSFTSASLNPPLITFNVGRDAQMHDLITSADRFAVHVLTDEQVTLSNRFAIPDTRGEDQFRGVPHHIGGDGLPILHHVLAVLYCRLYAVYPAGDHSIIVGEVAGIEQGEPARPMLYFERSYRGVGEVVAPSAFPATNRSSSDTP